jgi:hypothetical protein
LLDVGAAFQVRRGCGVGRLPVAPKEFDVAAVDMIARMLLEQRIKLPRQRFRLDVAGCDCVLG